jgi:hypothetical protein
MRGGMWPAGDEYFNTRGALFQAKDRFEEISTAASIAFVAFVDFFKFFAFVAFVAFVNGVKE